MPLDGRGSDQYQGGPRFEADEQSIPDISGSTSCGNIESGVQFGILPFLGEMRTLGIDTASLAAVSLRDPPGECCGRTHSIHQHTLAVNEARWNDRVVNVYMPCNISSRLVPNHAKFTTPTSGFTAGPTRFTSCLPHRYLSSCRETVLLSGVKWLEEAPYPQYPPHVIYKPQTVQHRQALQQCFVIWVGCPAFDG